MGPLTKFSEVLNLCAKQTDGPGWHCTDITPALAIMSVRNVPSIGYKQNVNTGLTEVKGPSAGVEYT